MQGHIYLKLLKSSLQERDEKERKGTGDKGQETLWTMLENAGGATLTCVGTH